jgi:hypothetical protein
MLLLTFTNKAAREMVRRVETLTQGLADPRKLLGGTFHHVAHAVLRTHGQALGLSPDFSLLDREDARTVMAEALSDVTAGKPQKRLPRPEVLVELASLVANTGLPLDAVLADRRPAFVASAEVLGRAVARFSERKRKMNLLDFDDLLVFLRQLLVEQPVVRNALREGRPELAASILGRPFAIEGEVRHGRQLGRTLGYPTANVELDDYVAPRFGVYATRTRLSDGRTLAGVANIGVNPTVAGEIAPRLEVWLFDFDEDLYGQVIETDLIAFLRPEAKFASLEEMTAQIDDDASMARRILSAG